MTVVTQASQYPNGVQECLMHLYLYGLSDVCRGGQQANCLIIIQTLTYNTFIKTKSKSSIQEFPGPSTK